VHCALCVRTAVAAAGGGWLQWLPAGCLAASMQCGAAE
jgi:hypothetical protein